MTPEDRATQEATGDTYLRLGSVPTISAKFLLPRRPAMVVDRATLERVERALQEIQGHSGDDPILIESIAEEARADLRGLLAEGEESREP